jgi:hypothetical protein
MQVYELIMKWQKNDMETKIFFFKRQMETVNERIRLLLM